MNTAILIARKGHLILPNRLLVVAICCVGVTQQKMYLRLKFRRCVKALEQIGLCLFIVVSRCQNLGHEQIQSWIEQRSASAV